MVPKHEQCGTKSGTKAGSKSATQEQDDDIKVVWYQSWNNVGQSDVVVWYYIVPRDDPLSFLYQTSKF